MRGGLGAGFAGRLLPVVKLLCNGERFRVDATGNFGYVEIRVAAPRALCPQLASGVVVENRQLVATAVTLGL